MRAAALVLVGVAGLACRRGALQEDAGGIGTIPGADGAAAADGSAGVLDAPAGNDGPLPPPDSSCGVKNFVKSVLDPEILVVLDRSISVDPTRWSSFLSSVASTITANNAKVDWGLYAFPPNGPACGTVSAAIDVVPGPESATHVVAHMIAAGTGGSGTPAAAAIDVAAAYMRSRTTVNPKFLLLVTDAIPNCPDPAQGQAAALSAITEANETGIPTMVLAPSTTTVDVDALNDLAQAGGYPQRGDVQFFTEATIGGTFQPIGDGTCAFNLGPTPPPVPDHVTVTLDGDAVPRDRSHVAGWDYLTLDAQTIALFGPWCDQWNANKASMIRVSYGCPIP